MRAQTISLSRRRKKKLERQVEKYLTALKSHRNDYKLHIDLGDTYIELDNAKEGVSSYYTAIDLLREAPNVNKTRNLVLELYEKIIHIIPNDSRTHIELSEEYIAAGQKEKAFRFLLSSAKTAYEEENYELALACYNQVITNGRTNPHIVERCTELYLKLERKEEATQNYVKIGDMYAQEEKNIEALEYYKKACALDQNNPELHLKVARMYNAMAWTENAAAELVKVGEYYEHQREYTEALRYYNYSVRLDPENERAQEGRFRINQSPSLDGLVIREDLEEIRPHKAEHSVLDELDLVDDLTTEGRADSQPIDVSAASDATVTFEASSDEAENQSDVQNLGVLDVPMEEEQSKDGLFSSHEIQEMLSLDDDVDLEFTPTKFGEGAPLSSAIDDATAEFIPEEPLPEALAILDEEDGQISAKIIEPDLLPADEQEAPEQNKNRFNTSDSEHEAALQLDTLFMDEDRESRPEEEQSPLAGDMPALPPSQNGGHQVIGSLDDWIIDLKEDELVELALEEALQEQEAVESANWEQMLGLDLSSEQDMTKGSSPQSLTETTEPGENIEEQASTLQETGETLWFDEASEQVLDTFLEASEKADSSDETMLTDEDAVTSQNEIIPEIDTSEDTLEEFAYNNNGAGAFLHEREEREDEDRIGVPFSQENDEEAQSSPQQQQATIEFSEDDEEAQSSPQQQQATIEFSEVESEDIAAAEAHETEPDIVPVPVDEPTPQNEIIAEEYVVEDDIVEESALIDEDIEAQSESEDVPEVVENIRMRPPETRSGIGDLHKRVDDLEQQLERTEEEKYFLQERFAAQISQHRAHEESLQQEIAKVYHNKDELEKRLQQDVQGVSSANAPSERSNDFDGARYDTLVEKIEQKKAQIERHVHSLLKKRETSGRFLKQEITTLNTTKQRLQQNLEHIQHIKTRVETKINTELHQAKEEVENLTKTSQHLEAQLYSQQQREHALQKQFNTLRRQKEKLQEEYDTTLETLQHERTNLEQQLQHMTDAKTTVEKTLKKKLYELHRSYQQLKGEYKTVIELKDAQLQKNAQKLRNVTGKYKKLEKILADIRKERNHLNTRLSEETAVRQVLEEKLLTIEKHVDAMDVQEEKLLNQLGQELERHFTLEQHVTNKFQLSLEELEGLLALQEQEIHNLEAV